MTEISEDPEFKEWAENVRAHLLPMISESALTFSIVPEDPTNIDIKFAVELGVSIMLDKPIIAVVQPGTKVPERLLRVADHIIDVDLSAPDAAQRVQQAITAVMEELG